MTRHEVEDLCQQAASILGLSQSSHGPHDVVGADNHIVVGFVALHAHVPAAPPEEVLDRLRELDATVVLCIGKDETACAAPLVVKVHHLDEALVDRLRARLGGAKRQP